MTDDTNVIMTHIIRRRGLVKPSFMAPPEPLDRSLAKTLVADSDSDSEPEVRMVTDQREAD